MLAGVEDLNNNYLPGVNTLVDQGKVSTYFAKAPYMLSANTAWLEPNTTVKPLNDPVFRKALAESINVNQIVAQDYQNLVLPANPTGPAADLEQVRRQRVGRGERLQVQHV